MQKVQTKESRKFERIEEFERTYFPEYSRHKAEKAKAEKPGAFGHALANEFITKVRSALRK